MTPPIRKAWRQAAFWAALILCVLGVAEILGLAGLGALSRLRGVTYDPVSAVALPERARVRIEDLLEGRTRYIAFSPVLGWTLRQGAVAGLYRVSSQGLRADRDYAHQPPTGIVRVAALGDAFTHGDEASNEETWTRQLESLDPRLEVLNFGVMGYAPDQALLRYDQEGKRFGPQVVLLSLTPGSVSGLVSVFRAFSKAGSDLPLAKPRFLLDGDRLVLLPNPLPGRAEYVGLFRHTASLLAQMGEHDLDFRTRPRPGPFDFYAPVRVVKLGLLEVKTTRADRPFVNGDLNADSEAFHLLARLVEEFRARVLAEGSLPAVVILPEEEDVSRFRHRGTRRYEPLLEHLRRRQHFWMDLTEGLASPAAGDAMAGGHYTAKGNALVARSLRDWFVREGVLDPESRRGIQLRLQQAVGK